MSGNLNVVVTGATGKQGGHLVRELVSRGHSVRALTRKPESPAAAALAARGVTRQSVLWQEAVRRSESVTIALDRLLDFPVGSN